MKKLLTIAALILITQNINAQTLSCSVGSTAGNSANMTTAMTACNADRSATNPSCPPPSGNSYYNCVDYPTGGYVYFYTWYYRTGYGWDGALHSYPYTTTPPPPTCTAGTSVTLEMPYTSWMSGGTGMQDLYNGSLSSGGCMVSAVAGAKVDCYQYTTGPNANNGITYCTMEAQQTGAQAPSGATSTPTKTDTTSVTSNNTTPTQTTSTTTGTPTTTTNPNGSTTTTQSNTQTTTAQPSVTTTTDTTTINAGGTLVEKTTTTTTTTNADGSKTVTTETSYTSTTPAVTTIYQPVGTTPTATTTPSTSTTGTTTETQSYNPSGALTGTTTTNFNGGASQAQTNTDGTGKCGAPGQPKCQTEWDIGEAGQVVVDPALLNGVDAAFSEALGQVGQPIYNDWLPRFGTASCQQMEIGAGPYKTMWPGATGCDRMLDIRTLLGWLLYLITAIYIWRIATGQNEVKS